MCRPAGETRPTRRSHRSRLLPPATRRRGGGRWRRGAGHCSRTATKRAFEDALALLASLNRRFDRARTHLLIGALLRRQRRRGDARTHLRTAVETFERLGAEPWAERARVELRATGETARKRDPSTVTQLTPQEMQIARLVGAGSSNKDVATQLFLSPRTVEYHLAKVFTKLGIASRADLIRQAAVLEPVG